MNAPHKDHPGVYLEFHVGEIRASYDDHTLETPIEYMPAAPLLALLDHWRIEGRAGWREWAAAMGIRG